MRWADLKDRAVAVWGMGREGRACVELLRRRFEGKPLILIDESPMAVFPAQDGDVCARAPQEIADALEQAQVVVKSPGVRLYHPLVQAHLGKITSLLNLWLAEPPRVFPIGVTGTKGKSTTSALLAHVLCKLGKATALAGNIGVPVTDVDALAAKDATPLEAAVIEVSSYQAATLSQRFPVGVLTSLYPEHLDWHGSLQAYYRDKTNLLAHSEIRIANAQARPTLAELGQAALPTIWFNDPSGFFEVNGLFFEAGTALGRVANAYLARPVNRSNVMAVLAVVRAIGLVPFLALEAMEDFKGLPHRQQELGERNGVLYVDDSIATTPQSAIAAMQAYPDRPLTLIVGGQDRGIEYAPLIEAVLARPALAAIGMGPCGQRILEALAAQGYGAVFRADDMARAVALARDVTPEGGVILLSPAAPSYGLFKNFEERGCAFALASGFEPHPGLP